jgi:hypothetical protein
MRGGICRGGWAIVAFELVRIGRRWGRRGHGCQ